MDSENKLTICPVVSAKLNSRTREEIPVIISMKNNDNTKLSSMVFNMSTGNKRELPIVGGIACKLSKESINRLKRHPDVDYISFDSKVYALLDIANTTIETESARVEGFSGKGVTVAVIDTGVSPHTDLVKPRNRIIGFKDFVNGKTAPYDDNGHGTHIAGVIASSGFSSNGRYTGVAPDTNILGIKALDETGGGSTSDIVSSILFLSNHFIFIFSIKLS